MCLNLLSRHNRCRLRRAVGGGAVALAAWLVAASSALAQPGLGIDHDPLECIPITDFATFDAVLAPPDQVETCRLYFRSNISPDFYFVDMSITLEEGLFRAYLPKPTSETSSVEYYLECLATDFANARTIGHEAEVVDSADECRRRRPAAVYFIGDDPAIVVGSLNPAAPLTPPTGFSIEGLAAASSGLSRGVVAAAIVGGGVAGITAGVIASGDDPAAPLALPPTPPPPVGGGPPTAPTPIKACFEMSPSSGMVAVGETIGLDASCSTPSDLIYSWQLGDGRTRSGVFIRPVFREEGSFDVKLSVRRMADPSQGDETTMPVSIERAIADLQVEKFARAVCGGESENVEVRVKVTNKGPNTADSVVLFDSIPAGYSVVSKPGRCDEVGTVLSCRLGDMENDEMQELSYVLAHDFIFEESELRRLVPFPAARVSSDTADPGIANNESAVDFGTLTCFSEEDLKVGPSPVELQTALTGAANGRIQINGRQSVVVPGGAPIRARLQGARGTNRVEARIVGQAHEEGTWRFDFARSPGFLPGTLRVESGDVLAIGPDAITFRIGAADGPAIRFNLQLER